MATENKSRSAHAAQRKHRRQPGIPTMLVVALLVIALLAGGLIGFAVARKTDPSVLRLQEANTRIMELENTLTMIGFSVDEDDPESWIYDDTGSANGAEDLADGGGDSDDDISALWDDTGVLEGTLNDPGAPVVVAEFDGGQLLSSEVIPEYNEQLTAQVFAGGDVENISATLLQYVLSYMVSDKIIETRAQALGLDQLTDEDLKAIDAEAEAIYSEQLQYYAAFVAEEGMSDEEVRAAAAEYMKGENGTTLESIAEELRKTWWSQKFYDYVVKDVAVSDAEIQAHYDELLADQKENFDAYPEQFEYAHINGDIIVYRPEGYRAVRDVLIAFASEDDASAAADLLEQLDLLDPDKDGEAIEKLQAQLNELYGPLEATAQEALEKLRGGQSFAALMDEYGTDDMLAEEPLRSEGHYISSNSYLNSAEFVEGSMMLERPGDVSAPLRSPAGIHLSEYVADVPAGEVPLADVRSAVEAEALNLKQAEYYEAQRNAMLEEANVKYYPEVLQ